MANALILYVTKHGQTAKIARHIAESLLARRHDVELVDAARLDRELELSKFQHILVVAPIYMGGYPRAIERFVRKNSEVLAQISSAFLSVGLAVASRTSDGEAQTRAVVERFVKRTGWRPRRIELIAGALPYSKYNFFTRFALRRIAAHEGGDTDTSRDYEYTNWNAVDQFALETAHSLGSMPGEAETQALSQGVGSQARELREVAKSLR